MRGLFAALAVIIGLAATPALADIPPGAVREQQAITGLEKPAQILVDQWGVPHIYAASERDAFFLQGWNAARDRLWQIDLWRKRGLGRLAASFGPAYVAQDRAARLFVYRGDMAAEWAAYGPSAKGRAEAFTAGVNAYVAAVLKGEAPLPVEFTLTGSKPELWEAADIVRIRSHALTRNADSEVARARVTCLAGLGADTLRRNLDPPWTTSVPVGLDPCAIPADVLENYVLATREVSFEALARRAPIPPVSAAPSAEDYALLTQRIENEGSNNWVVAPSRTATGRPLLANDPHRALGAPSLRYLVQLEAPGLSVIGAGEPSLPGVSLGHNARIAFGFTIFPVDQEDLYVYALNPANPLQYRYRGRWEPMRTVTETIEVKGEAPREITLAFTRHGPVIRTDDKGQAFALRTVWSEPGTNAYFGSIDYMDAQTWEAFRASMARWRAPAENLVFASVDGDIGWIAAGLTPRRTNFDGLMPVPGDGRYEWAGFLTPGDLPSVHNPASGFFASANEMNLPEGFPIAERRVGFEWNNPSRATRLKAVLGANAHFSITDAMALQTDPYSTEACRLKALLAPLTSTDPDTARALDLIKAWDCRLTIDSAAAALYENWSARHLGRALVGAATPPAARPVVGEGYLAGIVVALERPSEVLPGFTPAQRDAVLLASLIEAFHETQGLLGPDPARWRWGDLHRALFIPAAARLASSALLAQMTVGPLQVRGGASTPAAATWRPTDFGAISGASVRMVMDVGAWDNSVAINSPGQSGDPFSAHYRDLFPLWAAGEYFPLLYSRAAVEGTTRRILELRPG